MYAIASDLGCAVKFVNSFARCQHLFDNAAKHRLTLFEFSVVACSLVPVTISFTLLAVINNKRSK